MRKTLETPSFNVLASETFWELLIKQNSLFILPEQQHVSAWKFSIV